MTRADDAVDPEPQGIRLQQRRLSQSDFFATARCFPCRYRTGAPASPTGRSSNRASTSGSSWSVSPAITQRLRHYAHLDPDLDRDALASCPWMATATSDRPASPKVIYGSRAYRRAISSCSSVCFGRVERTRSGWRFIRQAVAKHILWGWLQIGKIYKVDELTSDALPWARYHPHFQGKRDVNNTLYIAADRLRLNGRGRRCTRGRSLSTDRGSADLDRSGCRIIDPMAAPSRLLSQCRKTAAQLSPHTGTLAAS